MAQHWASTEAGKAKLSRAVKRGWKRRRAALKAAAKAAKVPRTPTPRSNERKAKAAGIPADISAYALGHIECWIDHYAASSGVSRSALAAELGAVLQGKSVR
jgi:hypothetical protein